MQKTYLFLLSSVSGLLLSLPWMEPSLSWVLLFAFVPLLLGEYWLQNLTDKSSVSTLPFGFGFNAFFIWNILSVWWLAHVSFAGMLFIVIANALLMATVWFVRGQVQRRLGYSSGLFALVVFWMAFEFLSFRGLLPWPWLVLGNGFANQVEAVQWYEFTGVLGGTLWVLLCNVLIFSALVSICSRFSSKSVLLALLAFVAIAVPRVISLAMYNHYVEQGIDNQVVVVQPNVNPYTEKFSIDARTQTQRLVDLVAAKITDSTDWAIMPETSLPIIDEGPDARLAQPLQAFDEITRRYPDLAFVAGALSRQKSLKGSQLSDDGVSRFDNFNSAVLFGGDSKPLFAHKNILVAGVEREPFSEYFSFLPTFLINLGGVKGSLVAGQHPEILIDTRGNRLGAIICFESVFGEYVAEMVQQGAGLLAVITNDGWWKGASGTWQHFGYSRLRAIETRRAVARSANTGISGVINQRGDIIAISNINTCYTMSCSVKANLSITFYTRYGDYLGRIALLLSGLVGLFFFVSRKINN